MSHRFLVPLVILGSVGLAAGLTPTLAEASTAGQSASVHSTSATLRSTAAPGAAAGLRTLRAPATKSHYERQAPAGAAATAPNPNLAVAFSTGGISALGVTLNAGVTGYDTATAGGLSATVDWGDGTSTNYSDVGTSPSVSHVYNSTGTYSITLMVSDGAGDSASTTWSGLQTEGSEYTPYPPTRILDTRKGIGAGTVKQIPANGSLTLTVAGAGQGVIPTSGGTSAIAMNLTATNSAGSGNITAYPAGESVPATSNVNYAKGQTVANMAILPIGTNGQVVFRNNSSGPVDLIGDAVGYFTTGQVAGASAYVPLTSPTRDLDTRPNALPAGTPDPFPGSVSWATSLVYNATVTAPTSGGNLQLYPYDPKTPNALPSTSNLNYGAGQTVPNLAIVPLGTVPDTTFNPPAYEIGINLVGRGSAQVILDLFGFFADQ